MRVAVVEHKKDDVLVRGDRLASAKPPVTMAEFVTGYARFALLIVSGSS